MKLSRSLPGFNRIDMVISGVHSSIRLHDARHTHASLMLKQGIHPKIVQERLGHASIQITLDTYSHVAPGLQQAAANRFDDIVLTQNQGGLEKEVREFPGLAIR